MIRTLAWKEFREHWPVWITMVLLTVLLGVGLGKIVSLDNPRAALGASALTILALAATYGIVCGGIMFAGEHETGTLVFLDIFYGRRGLLWSAKWSIGVVLAVAQGLTVGALLVWLEVAPPEWVGVLVGESRERPAFFAGMGFVRLTPMLWLIIMPTVTLEALAWGLFGSAFGRRVLEAAAIAAVAVAPIWLVGMCCPPPMFVGIRIVAALVVLGVSHSTFVFQSKEPVAGPTPPRPAPIEDVDPRVQDFLEQYEEFEREDRAARRYDRVHGDMPVVEPASRGARKATIDDAPVAMPMPRQRPVRPARSIGAALWWLTMQQAGPMPAAIGFGGFFFGLFVATNLDLLWPIATLLVGIACGTAAFAAEQRDLSYQFLSCQHFPLRTIWRFKITFWFAAAVLTTIVMALPIASISLYGAVVPNNPPTTLRQLMGPVAFYTIWLLCGFGTAQVVVWLCRKTILALLVSVLVAAALALVWLPSLLCGGMIGWQAWAPPLLLLAATRSLVRAWACGRITERKPMTALVSFGAAGLAWMALVFAYRAWQIPNVGEPIDVAAFRMALPALKENLAGKKIEEALLAIDDANEPWRQPIAELAALPVGVIEIPRADGQSATLLHLPACRKLVSKLRTDAERLSPPRAIAAIDQMLALSRNLRNKAPVESYLEGIAAENAALEDVKLLIERARPTPDNLASLLEILTRHGTATPPALDCLRTECFRSSGMADFPTTWSFGSAQAPAAGRVTERWLAGCIALSLEMPWEDERKTRLWQLVWVGLLSGIEQPSWEATWPPVSFAATKESTRRILRHWVAPASGPGSSMTAAQVAGLLDRSWLSDERLFCSAVTLRSAALRARCRAECVRLGVALTLYEQRELRLAKSLGDLVPKYLGELPIDPYSGQSFRYRVSDGERLANGVREEVLRPGQAIVWSTGPDRVDHGGRRDGDHLHDDSGDWSRGQFDLIHVVPR
jgi:hypothetical protein